MERLTKRVDGIAVLESWAIYKDPVSIIQRLCNRLSAYEDTGLEPEDVRRLQGDWTSLIMTLDEMGGMPHLHDLLQAEQDGRLVVLPCGTDVELIRDGYALKADHWNHTLTAFRDEPKNKSGKQIALFSTKEAEAALKGGDSPENRAD